jgi:predicted amidophosphoribosyltransferase
MPSLITTHEKFGRMVLAECTGCGDAWAEISADCPVCGKPNLRLTDGPCMKCMSSKDWQRKAIIARIRNRRKETVHVG